jgi:hypothetical protein
MNVRRILQAALAMLALVALAGSAHAQSGGDGYSIMQPEPQASPPKHNSRRGSSNSVYPTPLPGPQAPAAVPRVPEPLPRRAHTPPPIFVPQTGQMLPNLAVPGSGRGGAETGQDRALRCAHQAGVYGQAAGDRNTYVGTCVNQ